MNSAIGNGWHSSPSLHEPLELLLTTVWLVGWQLNGALKHVNTEVSFGDCRWLLLLLCNGCSCDAVRWVGWPLKGALKHDNEEVILGDCRWLLLILCNGCSRGDHKGWRRTGADSAFLPRRLPRSTCWTTSMHLQSSCEETEDRPSLHAKPSMSICSALVRI